VGEAFQATASDSHLLKEPNKC